MNKFAAIALFALFACAAASPLESTEEVQSEPEFYESETAYLPESNRYYANFCINSRNHVGKYLRSQADQAVQKFFNTMFSHATEIAAKAIEAQSRAVQEGSNAIVSRSDASVLERLSDAMKGVSMTVIQTVSAEFMVRLESLLKEFERAEIKDKIKEACKKVILLQEDLAEQLKDARRASGGLAPAVELSSVGCLTSSRIYRLSGVCNVITLAGDSIFNALGWNSTPAQ